jgi:CMP/dCMP kinase
VSASSRCNGRSSATAASSSRAATSARSSHRTPRSARRSKELTGVTVSATQADLARRDRLDSTRMADPLTRAADAVELDTTCLGLDEVIAEVVRMARDTITAGDPARRVPAGDPHGEERT